MKIWTYAEMNAKVQKDLDLEDETFIKPDEMVGYFNEALTEAESEILLLNQDYFLTKFYLPQYVGVSQYDLPTDIFANKIRGVVYSNGALIYPIKQIRRKDKFEIISNIDQYGTDDEYRYMLTNDRPGQATFRLYPPSRETALLDPTTTLFAPIQVWFLRNCARVPLVGEYCNPEVIAPSMVDIAANTIQTYSGNKDTIGTFQQGLRGGYPGSLAYITGDKVQFRYGPSQDLPGDLLVDTTYYVIALGGGLIKLATTLANARAGTAIDLTYAGTVYSIMEVCATSAIVDATLIDIPEFSTFIMQWVKCRCMEKEGDPRLEGAVTTLEKQRKQLNDTLVTSIDDDDNTVQADLSFYNEMS